MFGDDFLTFKYDKEHGTKIDESIAVSILEYSHDHWEKMYDSNNEKKMLIRLKTSVIPDANHLKPIPLTNKKRHQSALFSRTLHPP